MKNLNRKFLVIGFLVFVVGAFMPAYSFADVDVYVEGAYTETDLVVYIYADIDGDTVLRSAGVKLTYSPSELTVGSAEKNEDDWFMGAGGQEPEEYMDPEIETTGEVVIILGKLDTDVPGVGVSGTRVLLGKVSFTRTESSMPYSPDLSIGLGRTGDFANFVDTEVPLANVLDASITFGSAEIHERGDANGSGTISTADYITIRNNIGATDFPPWMDCNGSESISTADYICVRNKM